MKNDTQSNAMNVFQKIFAERLNERLIEIIAEFIYKKISKSGVSLTSIQKQKIKDNVFNLDIINNLNLGVKLYVWIRFPQLLKSPA